MYFMTAPLVRDQILKFIKEMINNRLIFDATMILDCREDRYDAIKEVVSAMRQIYIGVPLP